MQWIRARELYRGHVIVGHGSEHFIVRDVQHTNGVVVVSNEDTNGVLSAGDLLPDEKVQVLS